MHRSSPFLPGRESDLLQWADNFASLLSATPEAFGVTADQAAQFNTLYTQAQDRYSIANNNMTRSPGNIVLKDEAFDAMRQYARLLARQIQGVPTVTNAQKLELGLNVKSHGSPQPPPPDAPEMDIMTVIGRTVKLRVHNEKTLGHRGKPPGVKGVALFTFVGESAPDNINLWHFEGNSSRTIIEVEFPGSVPPGSKVWITAYWFNDKMESGPACEPNGINLAGGMTQAA